MRIYECFRWCHKWCQVKNNNRITKSIITFSGINLGKDYSQEQLNEILLNLYSTNFSDIKFNIEGNTLIVEFKRKIVQKIILDGLKQKKLKNQF